MSKFCFEIYEYKETKEFVFKGYKTVNANDTEQAKLSASVGLPENHKLVQIYISQN
jgi:hypothetical protein